MTDRRGFLSATLAAGIGARFVPVSPSVDASTTVFYGHPAGETTLVRFAVRDADAPAGRLRVFDGSGSRLIGTAGVLRVGDRLVGDVWLPLRTEARVWSVLEMPGLSRPLRTMHALTPRPQWTIHWLTIADPNAVRAYLHGLPLYQRAAAIALMRRFGVAGNPTPDGELPATVDDHLPFLERPFAAHDLQRQFGLARAGVAFGPQAVLGMRAMAAAAADADVRYAAIADADDGAAAGEVWGRNGQVLPAAPLMPGATPEALGFEAGGDVMADAVERWLTETPALLSPTYVTRTALVVGTRADASFAPAVEAVRAWNGRYAYPRILPGEPDAFFSAVYRPGVRIVTVPAQPGPAPDVETRRRARDVRNGQRDARLNEMFDAVTEALRTGGDGLEHLARRIDTVAAGTLVINPSPVPRSDVVRMPDGTEQWATNVPAQGYAFLLGRTSSAPPPFEQLGPHSAFGRDLTIRLDPDTGAVTSCFDRTSEREWVRAGGPGLNAIAGARLRGVTRMRLPEIGMRLQAERDTPSGRMVSTVTTYDDAPWVDIVNEVDGGAGTDNEFAFEVPGADVGWETPAGFETHAAPVGPIPHLRWLRVESADRWHILWRSLDAPYVSVAEEGGITNYALGGRTHYRFRVVSPTSPPDEPWNFGWSAEPLRAIPVSPVRDVPARERLPRFGQLFSLNHPDVMVLGMRPARNRDGVIVFLQEVLGAPRDVTLTPGILGFRGARRVDILERHLGELPLARTGAVTVAMPPFGIVAIRLFDLFTRGA